VKHIARLFAAVILPVSLGLGLIYLSATGRMEPIAALSVIALIAVIVPLAASLARHAREETLYRSYEPAGQLARR